jgi:hypothetical protein
MNLENSLQKQRKYNKILKLYCILNLAALFFQNPCSLNTARPESYAKFQAASSQHFLELNLPQHLLRIILQIVYQLSTTSLPSS